MKYMWFAVVLGALIPSPIHAQNAKFSNCRSLEAADNFVGSDEALVDGMVCKVVKPKTGASTPVTAPGKTGESQSRNAQLGIIEPETLRAKEKPEGTQPGVVQTKSPGSAKTEASQKRMALLGVIEPETLRSKLEAEATAAGKVETTEGGTETAPETAPVTNEAAAATQFQSKHNQGLGDIARAYQKKPQDRAAEVMEEIPEPKRRTTRAKLEATPAAVATETATTAPLQTGEKASALTVSQVPASAVAPVEAATTNAPAPIKLPEPRPATKTEVFAAPPTPAPAAKVEASLPAVEATPVATPQRQPVAVKTEVFAAPPTPTPAPAAKVEASLPVVEPAPAVAPEPQPAVKTEVFVAPPRPTPVPAAKVEASLPVVEPAPVATPAPQPAVKTEVFEAPKTTTPAPEAKVEANVPAVEPTPVATPEPQPAVKTEVFVAPKTTTPEAKVEATSPTVEPAPVATPEPQPAAKTEVFATPLAPEPQPAVKTEVFATPPTPETQPAVKTEVFAAPKTTAPEAKIEANSPAVGAAPGPTPAEDVAPSEPPKIVSTGVFTTPEESRPPDIVSYPEGDEAGFNDGQRAGCIRNVSLGSLDKERLFLAIPDWATDWYVKNQKRFPGMCFSDSPMPGAKNFLVVFYTTAPAAPEIDALKKISSSPDLSPTAGVGSFTTGFGSTWHYTFERTATTTITTVLTEKVPHNVQTNIVYATAYSEQGIPIAQHWPTTKSKKGNETSGKPGKNGEVSHPVIQMMSDLLNQMAEDIAKH